MSQNDDTQVDPPREKLTHDDPAQTGRWPEAATPKDESERAPTTESYSLHPGLGAERYQVTGELGRGGMGVVVAAKDEVFRREVALKQLLSHAQGSHEARFLKEARITAQLQHPNVPPVHDLGRMPDGRPFFAMKMVRGRSLATILSQLEAGDEATVAEFGRLRLLTLFQQLCMAVDYAHSRRVIHRDLKPDNIMVGEYGEVYVMDWGVAKRLDDSLPSQAPGTAPPAGDDSSATAYGDVVGTPSYMPPEQAQGQHERIGACTDIYALGAILYELLTGQPPFRGPTVIATLLKVIDGTLLSPRQRAPDRSIPISLDELCVQALSRAPEARPASARALYDAIGEFLEGRKEAERRHSEATRLSAEGRSALAEAARAERAMDALRHEVLVMEKSIQPHAAPLQKSPLWQLEDRLEGLKRDSVVWAEKAIQAFTEAVRQRPNHDEARRSLAQHYWARLLDAEAKHDMVDTLHYKSLVEHYNDGSFDGRLDEVRPLKITTEPTGAELELLPLVEHQRVLRAAAPLVRGRTPSEAYRVPRGSYLLRVLAEGFNELLVPVLVSREERIQLHLRLFPSSMIGDGFVHIPGGPAILGGDPEAPWPAPRQVVELPDFALAESPITCGEYVHFLNGLVDQGEAEQAYERVPRELASKGHYWQPAENGRFQLPIRDADGDLWDQSWPVMGVSYDDALAYCSWHSEAGPFEVRLPSADEWEKAARGVDGRYFPWGNRMDPTFCKMRSSTPGTILPEPVRSYPTDCSPYGVRDLAGAVREWTSSRMEGDMQVLKGGAWNLHASVCRVAGRWPHHRSYASTSTGFRLARDLP